MKAILGLALASVATIVLSSCCCQNDPCCGNVPPAPRCCEPRPCCPAPCAPPQCAPRYYDNNNCY